LCPGTTCLSPSMTHLNGVTDEAGTHPVHKDGNPQYKESSPSLLQTKTCPT